MQKLNSIYLDNNSTTPIDPKVLAVIDAVSIADYGNAASNTHDIGKNAKSIIEKSRRTIANGLGCAADEIIFTSGATESLNLAIKGLSFIGSNKKKKHIITTNAEHKAVLDSCEWLEKNSVEIEYLAVDKNGFVSKHDIRNSIKDYTILVSVIHGNNEIGTINDIEGIGKICNDKNVPFLVDAAQTFGKIPIDVNKDAISMLAGSGHKIYGPKGVGFLYKKKDLMIDPIIHGGGHEFGLRSGTANVSGIAGLAVAFKVMLDNQDEEKEKLYNFTKKFIAEIERSGLEFFMNGPESNRLPGNINICLKGVDADWLCTMLNNVAIARGSACTSETIQPSHVLRSIGLKDDDANSSIRVSFGRFNTIEDVNVAVSKIVAASNK